MLSREPGPSARASLWHDGAGTPGRRTRRLVGNGEGRGLPDFRTLAIGLERDQDAVRAALSLSWSNGPTEGHVHRLKLIKRQMYGRAKFDLLRRRVLHGY